MKSTLEKSTLIPCGHVSISIGTYSTSNVAIVSKHSGEFCQFKHIVKGGKLVKIKRKFKGHLTSTTEFCFGHMSDADILELIKMLKK